MNGEAEGWRRGEVDGDELDTEQVKIGRKEELAFIVKKLDMFEFGTYEEAVSRASSRRRRSGSKVERPTIKRTLREVQDSRTRLEGAGKGRTTRSLCGIATSGVEGVVVQDGGCDEGAAEEKGARGGEADVC